MDYDVLGQDCDGNAIYEYMILRAMWSNDVDINELEKEVKKMPPPK